MWDIVLFDVLSDKNRTAVDGFLYFVLHCEQKCTLLFSQYVCQTPVEGGEQFCYSFVTHLFRYKWSKIIKIEYSFTTLLWKEWGSVLPHIIRRFSKLMNFRNFRQLRNWLSSLFPDIIIVPFLCSSATNEYQIYCYIFHNKVG